MGGTRIGFEDAVVSQGDEPLCVFSSEIKTHVIKAYRYHFKNEDVSGDITKIPPTILPDFDYLLAGFPCQPFSSAGNRKGFLDKRGNLFFTICDILKAKSPKGFLLENVKGLKNHNGGETLKIILDMLGSLGYKVSHKVLDSSQFSVPQKRERLYIIGRLDKIPHFLDFEENVRPVGEFIDYSYPFSPDAFSNRLTSYFSREQLEGKSIKDKRGGKNNINSWDINLKGKVNERQKKLLNEMLRKRRYKKWAINKGIEWMDGMPLTLDEIKTFINDKLLDQDLEYLTERGYLKYEHPKELVDIGGMKKRVYKQCVEKGFNIVAGKLSFQYSKILDPKKLSPTIVASEIGKIAVATERGVRSITIKEGLAFSGFPKNYNLDFLPYNKAFDLVGNTVIPPVIKHVSCSLLK